jgi:glutathione peroxidase
MEFSMPSVTLALAVCALSIGSMALGVEAPTTRPATGPSAASPLEFTVTDINGKSIDLAKYRGRVVLIVNTASKCGFTPQYAGLEKLYQADKDRGLAILGFPANDFGHQEPGTNEEIVQFCSTKYKVTFDLFSKIVVKGDGQAPLYQFLTDEKANAPFGGAIAWNFTKFLVARDGRVVNRFASKVAPDDPQLIKAVEAELAK